MMNVLKAGAITAHRIVAVSNKCGSPSWPGLDACLPSVVHACRLPCTPAVMHACCRASASPPQRLVMQELGAFNSLSPFAASP